MNKNLIKWVAALAMTAAAVAVIAMPRFGGMGDHDPARMIEHLSSRLDLDEQQQTQVSEIVQSAQVATAADREQMRQLHEQMKALTENFDAGAAQSTADEIGRVTSRLIYTHVSTMAEVRKVLNEEQLKKMAEMHERMEERKHMRLSHDREGHFSGS